MFTYLEERQGYAYGYWGEPAKNGKHVKNTKHWKVLEKADVYDGDLKSQLMIYLYLKVWLFSHRKELRHDGVVGDKGGEGGVVLQETLLNIMIIKILIFL